MKIIRNIKEMQEAFNDVTDKKIGFVPTMGYLHEGHLSLVKAAREENDLVVMSIFVNPLQFGPNEDFKDYPRAEERDIQIAYNHEVDYLFIPKAVEMYPNEQRNIKMEVLQMANVLCGKDRPGHFDGVVTVLTKLFHIVKADNVYFGMKDAQQLAIVKSLVNELNFPLNVIGINTVREVDGLALSSRNVYLSEDERKEALILYECLQHGQQLLIDGIKNVDTIITSIKKKLQATSGKLDYVELLTYPQLKEIVEVNETVVLAIAVRFNKARLIDNFIMTKDGQLIKRID